MTSSGIVVVSGVGEHADPWHHLPSTSAALAALFAELGEIDLITTDDLVGGVSAELIVLNAAADLSAPPRGSAPVVDALEAHHRRGGAILGLHSSALAFPDEPRWCGLLGGRWVPGVTMHPQIGHALIQASPTAADSDVPLLERDFTVYDERYCHLEHEPDETVIAHHTEDGITHPIIWWHTPSDGGPVAYDALGHGVESYECDGHRAWLLAAAARMVALARDADQPTMGER